MKSFRPFKLLNASERSRLVELASSALNGWRQAWTAHEATPAAVECMPAEQDGPSREAGDWLEYSATAGSLYIAGMRQALTAVGGALAGGPEPGAAGGASMAAELAGIGLKDLAERLMGIPASVAGVAPPPGLWARGSGAAALTLRLPDGEIRILLDHGLVAELLADLPRPPLRTTSPNDPQPGIGRLPLPVEAWLGSADIDLATLQSLAVNDVLLLDSRIDRPLRITVAGHETAPRAVLGQAGQRRAIRLTTYSPDN